MNLWPSHFPLAPFETSFKIGKVSRRDPLKLIEAEYHDGAMAQWKQINISIYNKKTAPVGAVPGFGSNANLDIDFTSSIGPDSHQPHTQ
jgi:hypothetical protein